LTPTNPSSLPAKKIIILVKLVDCYKKELSKNTTYYLILDKTQDLDWNLEKGGLLGGRRGLVRERNQHPCLKDRELGLGKYIKLRNLKP